MLQGRPLYDTPPDSRLFVAPPEWGVILRAIERGNNTLVYGTRGAGKTSLLRQLQLTLRDAEKPVAFVDASAIDDPLEFAKRTQDALKGRPGSIDASHYALAEALGDPSPPPGGASRALYDTLAGLGGDVAPTTILLDASASPRALHGIFGRMRDTVWQLPHTWVVAIDEDDRATALKPPADSFFDSVVHLEPRSVEDLRSILNERTDELGRRALSQIAGDARGNPRTAIRAASDALVRGHDPSRDLPARGHLLDAASELGRPHGMLMAELLDMGQASPSDEQLLTRLGLKRARVSTLLHELADAGLVESSTVRSDGPGRPRTIYRPALKDL